MWEAVPLVQGAEVSELMGEVVGAVVAVPHEVSGVADEDSPAPEGETQTNTWNLS